MAKESLEQEPTRRRLTVVVLAVTIVTLTILLFKAKPARSHTFPIIDGAFTGDWCGPLFKGAIGPDSYSLLAMPGCPLGDEIMWDDWDAAFYGFGIADTMGWLIGGVPGAPLSDPEVDISFMVTTADAATAYFAVELGAFPSTVANPPHVQIAVDVDGAVSGIPLWYQPVGVGVLPIGLVSAPPLLADYLITTDVLAGTAFVWEAATTGGGGWTMVGPVPLGWSGFTGGPGIIEIAVPWPMFAPGPPFGLGVPAYMTIMSAHSLAFAGPSDAPMTPQDDVITESGAGLTTSPDVCPPGPPSSDCELYVGPVGPGTQDAYIPLFYPPLPDFIINATPPIQPVCVGADAVYAVPVSAINGFAGPVALAVGGEPAGAAASFAPNGAIAPYTSTLTVTNILSNTLGNHTLAITGTWLSTVHTTTAGLQVIDVPPTISLTGPTDGAIGVAPAPTFTWQAETTALTYTLDVATDAAFANIVTSVTGISGTTYTLTSPLAVGTDHYWRIRGHNGCGPGSYSATWHFRTAWHVFLPVVLK